MEVGHVPDLEPPLRTLLSRDLDEARLEVDAIHRESGVDQGPCVCPGPAADVQNRMGNRANPEDLVAEEVRLGLVVLLILVEEIIEFRRLCVTAHRARSSDFPAASPFPHATRAKRKGTSRPLPAMVARMESAPRGVYAIVVGKS